MMYVHVYIDLQEGDFPPNFAMEVRANEGDFPLILDLGVGLMNFL